MAGVEVTINRSAAKALAVKLATPQVTKTTRKILNRARVLTPVRTGTLRASLRMTVTVVGDDVVGTVSTPTRYGQFVHDGTKPHVILPKAKKALKFRMKGATVFARKVRHPGTKARPFLWRAVQEIAPGDDYEIRRS